MSVFDFSDKVALVTGGASGIGRACIEQFAAGGAGVVIADRDADQGQQLAAELEARGSRALFVQTDVADADSVAALVERTWAHFGTLHFAVNSAGIEGERSPIGESSLDNWNRVIGIDLSGVYYCLRAQIPAILESGGGAVVNVGSIMSAVSAPGISAYVAAKHGVVGLTKTAAQEYSAQGVRVNAVCPGFIKTPMVEKHLTAEVEAQALAMHPIGRLGSPEDVAAASVYLCSEQSAFITGTAVGVDGGYLTI
ncbi:SDR family NAD(P)-dependent oxidoreductase [Microbulbifer taiwanensis]|uniref:SDR family NAD(P)-dependent oxidoreductase n=1 Tax=Microbulbifer taiwanensis TaxID=986746 RepID=A0ABW1YQN3_9GAMM|nr:glucose 1-dehydrogenase [Microbulbifer taiwanensis]